MKSKFVGRNSQVAAVLAVVMATGAAWGQQHGADREEPGAGRDPRVSTGPIAPLLEGLGDHHHPVTTKSPEAQRFFDQGLRLAYAFNHAEAHRAFQEAARLDPDCAMAYWGAAFVLGGHINQPMMNENVAPAWAALQKAIELKPKATQKERDYIDALAKRYGPEPVEDRSALDEAYARAMGELAQRYPNDDDALTLYVDALMNTMPWNYYTKDGRPKEKTVVVLELLERVLARNPDHAGAHHYYIHAVEEHHPEKAVASAERLGGLMPTAGHIVHMPSHIFIRVGRYADAYESNRLAVAADEGYITQCRAQGIYPLSYYPHNIHFLSWAALLEGRGAEALAESQKIARKAMEASAGAHFGLYETFLATPFYVMARFGKWEDALAAPEPAADVPFVKAVWHYARGLARLHTGKLDEARAELRKLDALIGNERVKKTALGFASGPTLLTIASETLAGELAAKRGRLDEALLRLERAVRLQDGLTYNEPPDWYYPVRHSLGAVLLETGRAEEAEVVYWEDLRRNPENGWALFGLVKALRAQGKEAEARAVDARFAKAWANADVTLTSSRF